MLNSLIEVQNVICECKECFYGTGNEVVTFDYDVKGSMSITHPGHERLKVFKPRSRYLVIISEIVEG